MKTFERTATQPPAHRPGGRSGDRPAAHAADQAAVLRLFVDQAPAAIAMFDRSLRCLAASPRWRADFGLADDPVGRSHYEVLPDLPERWKAAHRRALAGEVVSADLDRYERGDGRVQWLRWEARPWHTADGAIGGLVLFTEDISERKRAEEALRRSESRYRSLFDSIDEGFCIIEVLFDADGRPIDYRFVELNPAFVRQTGLAGAEGKRVRELVPKHEQHWFDVYGHIATTGEARRFELPAEELGRWYDVYAFRIGDPEQRQVAVLFEDVIERKRREFRLAFEANLIDDLAHLTTVAEITAQVGRRLQDLGIAHVFLSTFDAQGDALRTDHAWHADGAPSVPAVRRLAEYTTGDFRREAQAGRVIVVDDAAHDARVRAAAYAPLSIGSFVAVPYCRDDRWRFLLTVCDRRPRAWRRDEVELFRDLAYRLFPRLERARAEEALRQSEERFRSVFDHAAIGIAITDWSGRFENCNPAYCALVGYSCDELHALVVADLVHPDDRAANLAGIGRVQDGTASFFEVESRYVRKDGEPIWVRQFVSALRGDDGRPAHLVGLITDITERHRMFETLREADRRKDEFLAILAHELRNPLAPVRTAAEVIRLKCPPTAETQPAWNVVERQMRAMTRLIDDLMDVSRISRGRIELAREPTDLGKALLAAVDASRPQVEAAGHELVVSLPAEPIVLNADRIRLEQVIVNLLNNAARYCDRAGRIALRAERVGDTAVVSVQDTGIGVPAEQLETLFGLFAQVDSAAPRSRGGLGIGLYLARWIVEMHGGRIEAQSAGPGHGSEFIVRLPLRADAAAARPAAGPSAAASPAAAAPLKILVVDDNADAALTLAMLLEAKGHAVRTAADGPEALAAAAAIRPDVVLLDIGLPTMSGYEVAQAIRGHAWGRGLRLIAITGWGQAADLERSRAAGFDRHLVKPVDPQQLLALLAECGRGDSGVAAA